jgi:hypothetical protein
MRKLHSVIASALVATTALGVALPAQAQSYPRGYEDRYDRHDRDDDRHDDDDRRGRYDDRYDNRGSRGQAQAIRVQISDLERRVERLDGRDRISEREAAGLRNTVWRLREQFRVYNRDGLSRREAEVLRARIDQVRSRLHRERRDGDGRRW